MDGGFVGCGDLRRGGLSRLSAAPIQRTLPKRSSGDRLVRGDVRRSAPLPRDRARFGDRGIRGAVRMVCVLAEERSTGNGGAHAARRGCTPVAKSNAPVRVLLA